MQKWNTVSTYWHQRFRDAVHWANTATDIFTPQTFPWRTSISETLRKVAANESQIAKYEDTHLGGASSRASQPPSSLTQDWPKVQVRCPRTSTCLWQKSTGRSTVASPTRKKSQMWFLEPSLLMRMNGTKQFSFCTYQQAYCFFLGKI